MRVLRQVAVVEDEELDRRLAEPQQAEALEMVVELEAAAQRGKEQETRGQREPEREPAMRQGASQQARARDDGRSGMCTCVAAWSAPRAERAYTSNGGAPEGCRPIDGSQLRNAIS